MTDWERVVQWFRDHPGSSVMEVRFGLFVSNVTGRMSETSESNLVSLCGAHHRFKTVHGREVRPVLLAYLRTVTA